MKYEASEVVGLAREVNHLWVSRGKSVKHFDMKKDNPSDEELIQAMTGPTGNLRAPTIRRAKKLLVGFNLDEYEAQLK